MSNVQLASLEASDLLDVLHFMFEEDNNFQTGEQADARSKFRTEVYRTFYNRAYKYGVSGNSTGKTTYASSFDEDVIGVPETASKHRADFDPDLDDLKAFDPLAGPPKAYIPPTRMNIDSAKPFGNVLDAPAGR